MLQADSLRLCFVVAPQTMADDTEDVQLDFAADEQESARRSAVIRCTMGAVCLRCREHFVFVNMASTVI